jgi:NitT/TauT family transport system ATP-binding protein
MGQEFKPFPLEARLGTVLGLLELVVAYGGRADLALIARELKAELDDILPASEAAEQLGLLKIEDGEGVATPLGIRVSRSLAKGKKKILKEQLPMLEPFNTAMKLAKEKPEGFTTEELAAALSTNEKLANYVERIDVLHELLVDWMLYTELLSYDGDSRVFKTRTRRAHHTSSLE